MRQEALDVAFIVRLKSQNSSHIGQHRSVRGAKRDDVTMARKDTCSRSTFNTALILEAH
jgi:hypothetical protein